MAQLPISTRTRSRINRTVQDAVYADFINHLLWEERLEFQEADSWTYELDRLYIRFSSFCEKRHIRMPYYRRFKAGLWRWATVQYHTVTISKTMFTQMLLDSGYNPADPSA